MFGLFWTIPKNIHHSIPFKFTLQIRLQFWWIITDVDGQIGKRHCIPVIYSNCMSKSMCIQVNVYIYISLSLSLFVCLSLSLCICTRVVWGEIPCESFFLRLNVPGPSFRNRTRCPLAAPSAWRTACCRSNCSGRMSVKSHGLQINLMYLYVSTSISNYIYFILFLFLLSIPIPDFASIIAFIRDPSHWCLKKWTMTAQREMMRRWVMRQVSIRFWSWSPWRLGGCLHNFGRSYKYLNHSYWNMSIFIL